MHRTLDDCHMLRSSKLKKTEEEKKTEDQSGYHTPKNKKKTKIIADAKSAPL